MPRTAPRPSKEKKDYILDSMTDGKGSDVFAKDINDLRVFAAKHWPGKDIIEVRTLRGAGFVRSGYIAINRSKGIYYWIPQVKGGLDKARRFDPNTGRLTDPIPTKTAANIFSAVVHSVVTRREGHMPHKDVLDRVLNGKPAFVSRRLRS